MKNKLEAFAKKVEDETIEKLKADGLGCDVNIANARTSIKPGKKYTKVDIGGSGRYMVDAEGQIWGIKAYGVIHHGHYYGTLDTIQDYYWGHYQGHKKQVVTV
jgi:hypothetical protein